MEGFDVAIVGYGPVGATVANLLAMYGVRTAVYERTTAIYHLPRAVHFDSEVMRVFQSIGLRDAITAITIPSNGVRFLNRKGQLLFEVLTKDDESLTGTMFYQPQLEMLLRTAVERFDAVRVHYAHAVEAVEQDETGVTLTVRDMAHDTCTSVRARYVLACDGGRSSIRKMLGISMHDLGFHQPWLVVDTHLKEALPLPNITVQWCNPTRPITSVPLPDMRHRWEFMLVQGETATEMERLERVQHLLSSQVDSDKLEIVRASVYTFHALIARHWRKGNVFLLGDAAHQMPPFLGQGMCAGIRDAHNLCWKLALVLQGNAQDALLESYQREREAHVRAIIAKAILVGKIIQMPRSMAIVRDTVFTLIRRLPPAMALLKRPPPPLPVSAMASDRRRYRRSPSGTLFPQSRVATTTQTNLLLDDVLGPNVALIGYMFNPWEHLDTQQRAAWEHRSARFVTIVPVGHLSAREQEGTVVIEDSENTLRNWFRRYNVQIAVVRPDRYVSGGYTPDTLHLALSQLYGGNSHE